MKMTDFFSAQLEREAPPSRRALERVPEGRRDWKPHEKSMPLGYLSILVATMPSWIAMAITQNELDLNPPGGSKNPSQEWNTTRELLQALDESVTKARDALRNTTDAHLTTPWKLLVAGHVVMENPRRGDCGYVHAYGAPPRTAQCLSAPERCAGAIDLRTIRGRQELLIGGRIGGRRRLGV
jgi:hypothetical protein